MTDYLNLTEARSLARGAASKVDDSLVVGRRADPAPVREAIRDLAEAIQLLVGFLEESPFLTVR